MKEGEGRGRKGKSSSLKEKSSGSNRSASHEINDRISLNAVVVVFMESILETTGKDVWLCGPNVWWTKDRLRLRER